MVDQDVEPVEVRATQPGWWDWEVSPESLTFTLALALIVGTLLGYML